MEYTAIRYELGDGIATITKQNAEEHYMMSRAVTVEMLRALKDARNDDSVRVVVITSEGVHHGAAVVSEALMGGATIMQTREVLQLGHELCELIETIEKPVIGVVKTEAVGGGFETLQPCDFLICADSASFCQPEVSYGIIAGWGGVQRLSRMMGWRQAQKFLLLGEPVSGKEAERLGIVTQSVPLEEVDKVVQELCSKLLKLPLQALAATKIDLKRAHDMTQSDALACEVELMCGLLAEGLFATALQAAMQGQAHEFPPYHRLRSEEGWE